MPERHFLLQMACRIGLSLLKTWPRVESQTSNLRMGPSGLSPTIGELLMIHAQGLTLSKVEPFYFEFNAHRKSFVDENFHFATPTAAQQQRQRDGKMSTLLRDRQGHFRLKTRSLPSWTRQKKERWRTLSLLSYKQFLTWAPRLLSGTFMTIGWTFLPRTSVCTTRSI